MSEPAFFFVDSSGQRQDAALHADLLGDPEVEAQTARDAVERQLGKGMSLETAVSLFGTPAMQEAMAEGRPPFQGLQ